MSKYWNRHRQNVSVDRVKSLVEAGCSREQICNVLGIGMGVLNRVLLENGLRTWGIRDVAVAVAGPVPLDEVTRLRSQGLSIRAIAKCLGVRQDRVRDAVKSLGLPRLHKGGRPKGSANPPKVEPDEFRRLVAEGRTTKEIASHFAVADSTVYRHCRLLGVKVAVRPPASGWHADLDRDYVMGLVKANLTICEISKLVGVGRHRVSEAIRGWGERPSYGRGRRTK